MAHDKYKKDISNLETSFIDVYRVLSLFNVTDPCIQHAIKKLLCAGDRGVKDKEQDIREAKDCLSRYFAMRVEESAKSANQAKPEMPTCDIKETPDDGDLKMIRFDKNRKHYVDSDGFIFIELPHGGPGDEKTLSSNESKPDATEKENAGTHQINGFYGP